MFERSKRLIVDISSHFLCPEPENLPIAGGKIKELRLAELLGAEEAPSEIVSQMP